MNPPSSRRSLLQQQQPLESPATTFTFKSPFTILILLTVLFFMAFFSLYIRRFYTLTNSDDSPPHFRKRGSASGGSLRSLPVVPYGSELKMLNECSICLSEFEERETVKVIPYCRHGFHPVCIDTWLSSHVSCPLCRSTHVFPAVDEVRAVIDGDPTVVNRRV